MDDVLALGADEPETTGYEADAWDDAPLSALSLVTCGDAFFG